jgi:retron-type reverse transcriptase
LLRSGAVSEVDVDTKCDFDTISHDCLANRLRERIADARLVRLLESFLAAAFLTVGRNRSAAGRGAESAVEQD